MKTRNGFVSNSSSTSFCIYGIQIVWSEFADIIKNFNVVKQLDIEINSEDDETYEALENAIYEGTIDISDIESELLEKAGDILSFFYDGESMDSFYIGASFDQLKDNETGKQFKDRISKLISKATGIKNPDCSIIEDTVQS